MELLFNTNDRKFGKKSSDYIVILDTRKFNNFFDLQDRCERKATDHKAQEIFLSNPAEEYNRLHDEELQNEYDWWENDYDVF